MKAEELKIARETLGIALDEAFKAGVYGIDNAGPVAASVRLIMEVTGDALDKLLKREAESAPLPQLEAIPATEPTAEDGVDSDDDE